MSTRTERIAVFEDTMTLCRVHPRLSAAIAHSIAETRLYLEGQAPPLPAARTLMLTRVAVTSERSLEAAARLHQSAPELRIGVLNFASATHAGGGAKSGASAQEECLCRCTTLYPCLMTDTLMHDYYQMHRARHDRRYTDACIYTPDIIVCKTDTDAPTRMAESEWFTVDVLSCAAPNLRMDANTYNPDAASKISLTEAEQLALHLQRGRQILTVAAAHGIRALVLGAFGCGAFRNNPRIVATAYAQLLSEFEGAFSDIIFAVYCPPGHPENRLVFENMMRQR